MPERFPNLAKSFDRERKGGERTKEKSARVAQHKYSRISFLYLNLDPTLIGLWHAAARMSHIMCKSYASRLKWKGEGLGEAENGDASTK